MNNLNQISTWNNLSSTEKMAFGDKWIPTPQSNLSAWNKSFENLSPLKQQRALSYVVEFAKVKNHSVIGSGIN